jgi:hypothetical protein
MFLSRVSCLTRRKNTKKMEKEQTGIILPPAGYVSELAKLCDCSQMTVWRALRRNWPGDKADMVRKMYRTKYVNGK